MIANRRQLSRQRGAHLPEGVVYGARPSALGNPFRSDRFGHARAVGLHRAWLDGKLSERTLRSLGFNENERAALERLRQRAMHRLDEVAGSEIACWCPLTSKWCHVNTLLERAAAIVAARTMAEAA